MAKYVPDVKTQRWVIISPTRKARPGDVGKKTRKTGCPFCQGHEETTPSELYRIGKGEKNKPGWLVRVIPNKYPITDIHEVFVHSPDDTKNIESLPLEQVVHIMTAYRDRYLAHENDGHVIIFCNQGLHAGASLTHPHSQLVVVPRQINLDALSREPIANLVGETKHFITYCPDFSQWPYEVWIAAKNMTTRFGDAKEDELKDLALVMQTALKKIRMVFSEPKLFHIQGGVDFAYNYYISHATNWFVRIIPRFVHRAGFELGTGLNVNIVDPSEAAARLLTMKVR